MKGHWSRLNLCEALRASQDFHVTSVLSFPNANKTIVPQSLNEKNIWVKRLKTTYLSPLPYWLNLPKREPIIHLFSTLSSCLWNQVILESGDPTMLCLWDTKTESVLLRFAIYSAWNRLLHALSSFPVYWLKLILMGKESTML